MSQGSLEWQELSRTVRYRGRAGAAFLRLEEAITEALAQCTDSSVEGVWLDFVGRDEPVWIDRAKARRRAELDRISALTAR